MKNINLIDSELSKKTFDVESEPDIENLIKLKRQKNFYSEEAELEAEFSTNGIFISDQQGKIISWNDEMEVLTSIKHDDAINQYIWDMIYNLSPKVNQNPAFLSVLKKRFLTTINDWTHWKKIGYEHKLVSATGSIISVELSTFVSVSPNGNLLVSVVNELNSQKMPEKDTTNEFKALSKFNKFAVDLARLTSAENIESFVSSRLKDFVGALGIVYSEYVPDEHILTPKHIEFDPGLLEKLVSIFDQHVHKIHSSLHDYMYHDLVNNDILTNNSLFELSFGSIPYTVGNSVQTLLNADRFLRISFHLEGELYGLALLALPKNRPIPSSDLLEDFVTIASSAIKNLHNEETLQKNEGILRTITENTADTIWFLDEDGQILYSNHKIPGYAKKDITGRNFCEWTLPEYHSMMVESLNSVVSSGIPQTYESRALGINQEIRWYSSRLTPVVEGKKVKNVVLSTTDITDRKKEELALRVSEENYRVISQSTFDALFIIDRSGKQLFLNTGIEQVLGYKIEDVVGRLFSGFLPGDRVGEYQSQLAKVFQHKEPCRFESAMFHKDGHLVDVEINIKLIKLKGEYVAQGSIKDVSSRKQVEKQLKENISQHQALLSAIPDLMLSLDSEFKILELHSEKNDFVKEKPDTYVSKTADALFPAEVAPLVQQKVDHVISSGNPDNLTFEIENGEATKYFESRFIPFDKKKVMLLIRDVTPQIHSEKKLRVTGESYLDIFNSVPEAIYLLDESGTFLKVNKCAEDICQLPNEEFSGKTFELISCTDKNNLEEIADLLKKVAETGHTVRFNFWAKKKDGSEFLEEIIVNKGKYYGRDVLIAIARDITEKKLAEEEIELKNQELVNLNLEKDKFFSIIAHDLRSPFNSFLGLTQLMAEDLPNMSFAEIQTIVVSMGKSADNLYGLLENLLEWSRFQRGMISYKPEEFVLKDNIQEFIKSLLDTSSKKDLEVDFDVPENLVVYADKYMFSSILRNLTSNAIKFTPKGGKITLSAKQLNGYTELAISDNGIGMDENMIHKLFNLNEFTNRQGTEGELSTGLGLILCKEFVEKHQGQIWVESEVEKGSTFHFSIPGK